SEKEGVPILLVGSSRSKRLLRLLQAALAELKLAEVPAEHHGRAERLRRAQKNGYCLVACLDDWREWQSLADQLDMELNVVVEAVPIEDWYAMDEARRNTANAPTEQKQTTLHHQSPAGSADVEA